MTLRGLVLSFMCVFINPLYMLIIGAVVEIYKKIPSYFNYVLAFSFAIAIANREIGVQWYSDNGIGIDDAINYLNWYHQISINSYFLELNEVFSNILSGREPIWFLLAEIVGTLSMYNEKAIILVSTLLPIILFHYSFTKITRYFCFCGLVFYFLVPEIFHLLFHLYRTSIGFALLTFSFVLLLSKNRFPYSYYLAPLGHLSTILPAAALFLSRFITFELTITKKFFATIILSIAFFLGIYVIFIIAINLGFEKIAFYLTSSGETFQLSFRHLIYFLLSIFLIFITKNKYVYMIALSSLLVLFLPNFFDGLSIVFERILIVFIPLLSLSLVYEIKEKIVLKIPILFVLTMNFLYLISKVNGELFYQFMSNGNFFNVFSGILYNLYTY